MNPRESEARVQSHYDYDVTPSDMLTQRLRELGMSQTQLASRTGLSRKTINELVNGKQSITHDTALLLEPVLGYTARFWVDMQSGYDAHHARTKRKVAEAQYAYWPTLYSADALQVMHQSSLPQFFGVASYDAYTHTYVEPLLAHSGCQSGAVSVHDVAVWWRLGQIAAESARMPPYHERRLVQALTAITQRTCDTPADDWQSIGDTLAESGVLAVRMPLFAGVTVQGATYVHANTRVIQVSDACLSTQQGWFVLCHLVGHVVLHGVKAVFFEWAVRDDAGDDLERQADAFATAYMRG